MPSQELQAIENAIASCGPTFKEGLNQKLSDKEVSDVLAKLLWGITKNSNNKLVEIRDMEEIAKKGVFRYSGKADTMFNEGIISKETFDLLQSLPNNKEDTRHVGNCYLRVKGLLTDYEIRKFAGRQTAFRVIDYIKANPLPKPEGFVVISPNMTGGVYIGDETGKQLFDLAEETGIKAWRATPYMRETRKPIEVLSANDKIDNYWEGEKPTPEDTAMICPTEELRTAAETTQNATKNYRLFGYGEENKIKLTELAFFDYRHIAGVKRLKYLGVDGIWSVGGKMFYESSHDLGQITNSQYDAANFWLSDPWEFTKEIAPIVRKLA